MKGYHYTTYDNWLEIQQCGIRRTQLSEENKRSLWPVAPYAEMGCVWVFTEEFTPAQLVGQCIYVLSKHGGTRVVRLEIEYDPSESAEIRLRQDNVGVDVTMTHSLDRAGDIGHPSSKFDLILFSVPPANIKLTGDWDFAEFVK